MVNDKIYSIFKKGSKTYFYSSVFFPKKVKEDVFTLYAFVRKADDYVDNIPQQKDDFLNFKNKFEAGIKSGKTGDIVIDFFLELFNRKKLEKEWVDAFLFSMEQDLTKSTYESLDELKVYLYGSAEVVGLMMAKIMGLSKKAYPAARYLGRAMQYINFIRDINEDLDLKRVYFPQEDLRKYNIERIDYEYASNNRGKFTGFIRKQINKYFEWQNKAEAGFRFIPKRYLIPIKTASDMYKWTATQIYKDPFIIFQIKVKPSIQRIAYNIIRNTVNRT